MCIQTMTHVISREILAVLGYDLPWTHSPSVVSMACTAHGMGLSRCSHHKIHPHVVYRDAGTLNASSLYINGIVPSF